MDHNYSQPQTNIAHTDTFKRTAHPLSNVELPHALFQRYHPMAEVLLKYGRPFSSRFNFAIYTFNCCCCCCCVGFYFHLFVRTFMLHVKYTAQTHWQRGSTWLMIADHPIAPVMYTHGINECATKQARDERRRRWC